MGWVAFTRGHEPPLAPRRPHPAQLRPAAGGRDRIGLECGPWWWRRPAPVRDDLARRRRLLHHPAGVASSPPCKGGAGGGSAPRRLDAAVALRVRTGALRAPTHEQVALSPGQGCEPPGDVHTCSSSLAGRGGGRERSNQAPPFPTTLVDLPPPPS